MSKSKFSMLCVTSAGCLLSACSSSPNYVEEDFGSSVRLMVSSQIYDPVAAQNPGDVPPEMLDGVVAEETIKAYREDAKREQQDDDNPVFELVR